MSRVLFLPCCLLFSERDNSSTGGATTNAISVIDEPRRSPRIARHRFLTPTTTTTPSTGNSVLVYRNRDSERDREFDARDREIERENSNNSSQQSGGVASSPASNSQPSQQNYTNSQESQQRNYAGSVISSTGGTRGTGSSIGDSPTPSEIETMTTVVASPIDEAGINAMRRFVDTLHNYSNTGGGESRDRESSHRGDRQGGSNRRSTQGASSNRSSREHRRRGSMEVGTLFYKVVYMN